MPSSRPITRSSDRKARGTNPTRLLQLYAGVSLLSVIVFMVLLAWGMGKIFEAYHKRTTERESINIAYTLFQLERRVFLQYENGELRLKIPDQDFDEFDERMRGFLAPMDILKIKIFSPEQRVVYSTDPAIIGQLDTGNDRLQRALAGEVSSNLEVGETLADLSNELRFDVDLVETYLPLLDSRNNILGAFEIYLDITEYRNEINHTIKISLGVVALLLLVTFAILFTLMYRGTRQLNLVQTNLEEMANADPLTGLCNRRYLEMQLIEQFNQLRQQKHGPEFCRTGLIMVDLDHFKRVNDEHGHLVGDEILITLGQRLRAAVRDQDIVARYGGEEFMVVLPDAEPEQTLGSARRIWEIVRKSPMEVEGRRYPVTASLGVACFSAEDQTVWDALARADEALYKAKRDGRDRVCSNLAGQEV